jgi:hypothetical protein
VPRKRERREGERMKGEAKKNQKAAKTPTASYN